MLADFDADARDGFPGEVGLFRLDEGDDAVFFGVDGEVAGHVSPLAGELSGAGLANENLASLDPLATKAFDAEALTSVIMDVLGGTAGFYV